jgi:DNA-binding protein HU-beta
MTKADLVSHLAESAGITKVQSTVALDSLVEAVTKILKKEKRFAISGLGTFSVKNRKARKGRNPKTGATIKIKAKNVIRFKATKTLAEKI